jgi:hypothetical protein
MEIMIKDGVIFDRLDFMKTLYGTLALLKRNAFHRGKMAMPIS